MRKRGLILGICLVVALALSVVALLGQRSTPAQAQEKPRTVVQAFPLRTEITPQGAGATQSQVKEVLLVFSDGTTERVYP